MAMQGKWSIDHRVLVDSLRAVIRRAEPALIEHRTDLPRRRSRPSCTAAPVLRPGEIKWIAQGRLGGN